MNTAHDICEFCGEHVYLYSDPAGSFAWTTSERDPNRGVVCQFSAFWAHRAAAKGEG